MMNEIWDRINAQIEYLYEQYGFINSRTIESIRLKTYKQFMPKLSNNLLIWIEQESHENN